MTTSHKAFMQSAKLAAVFRWMTWCDTKYSSSRPFQWGIVALILIMGLRSRCQAEDFLPAAGPMPAGKHPRAADFLTRDTDHDGVLSEDEFARGGGADRPVLIRNFQVFDFDHDGRMTLDEFVTVPFGQADRDRGVTPEPIKLMSAKKLLELTVIWKDSDTNADDQLTSEEFSNSDIRTRTPGLRSTKFADWDLNGDQRVSRDELARVLDIAYGVCAPNGVSFRSNTGRVIDWIMFRGMKKNEQGMVSKADYFSVLGAAFPDREAWFELIDQNHDDQFDFAEFATSNHATDPVASFLKLDRDLNGLLSSDELDLLPVERFPVGYFLLPGFDDDQDGSLSLTEFQFSPVNNLLAMWQLALDKDNDGKLSFEEFRYDSGIVLSALCAEYFWRLDADQDQLLSLDEFSFDTNNSSVKQRELRVQSANENMLLITIPDYPNIGSPQLSPDGKWLAVDGSRQGQNDTAAHVLLVNLESDEVRDLGFGCLPHWSADSRRVCYSKYSGGVYVRDAAANGREEELIDARGWSIIFAPDGIKAAYTKGENLVILDLPTGKSRPLFAPGQSPYNYIEWNFAWSPESDQICFKGRRNNGAIDISIATTVGEDPKLRVLCDGKETRTNLSWHPGGKRVMFPKFPQPGQREQIFEIAVTGDQPLVRFSGQPKHRNNINLCWSTDGKTFVYLSTP